MATQTNSESRETAKAMANEVCQLMANIIQLSSTSPAAVTPLAWARTLIRLESVRTSALSTLDHLAEAGVDGEPERKGRSKRRRK